MYRESFGKSNWTFREESFQFIIGISDLRTSLSCPIQYNSYYNVRQQANLNLFNWLAQERNSCQRHFCEQCRGRLADFTFGLSWGIVLCSFLVILLIMGGINNVNCITCHDELCKFKVNRVSSWITREGNGYLYFIFHHSE